MYGQQGIAGFYRGVEANIMRACVFNATKMGVYDISKGYVCEASTYTGNPNGASLLACTALDSTEMSKLYSAPHFLSLYNIYGAVNQIHDELSSHSVASIVSFPLSPRNSWVATEGCPDIL